MIYPIEILGYKFFINTMPSLIFVVLGFDRVVSDKGEYVSIVLFNIEFVVGWKK